MKKCNVKSAILAIILALILVPFSVSAAGGKPTYEQLEERVQELEQQAAANEEGPTAGADVGVFSKYVWRGGEWSDDSIVIQPSITVEYKGFSMNLWGNLDTDHKDTEQSEFNETDLTLAYDTSIGDFDLGVGYLYYALEGANDPEEIYISLCAAAVPLAPTLTIYRDITEVIGWYLNLGVSHSFEFEKGITLDLAGSVGYYYSEDDDFVEVDGNGNATSDRYKNFHDGALSAGLTIPFCQYFTVCPMIAYSFPLSGEADDLITNAWSMSGDSDFFFGGVTLSIAF